MRRDYAAPFRPEVSSPVDDFDYDSYLRDTAERPVTVAEMVSDRDLMFMERLSERKPLKAVNPDKTPDPTFFGGMPNYKAKSRLVE
jgi:hypothetical protein